MHYRLRTLLNEFKPRDYLLFAVLAIPWCSFLLWSEIRHDWQGLKYLLQTWGF
jgi:hypothetical protein